MHCDSCDACCILLEFAPGKRVSNCISNHHTSTQHSPPRYRMPESNLRRDCPTSWALLFPIDLQKCSMLPLYSPVYCTTLEPVSGAVFGSSVLQRHLGATERDYWVFNIAYHRSGPWTSRRTITSDMTALHFKLTGRSALMAVSRPTLEFNVVGAIRSVERCGLCATRPNASSASFTLPASPRSIRLTEHGFSTALSQADIGVIGSYAPPLDRGARHAVYRSLSAWNSRWSCKD